MNHLQVNPPKHGDLEALSRQFHVSMRTLYAWRRGGGTGRPGRPPRPGEERERARELIAPRLKSLACGHRGWRSVCSALERDGLVVATRLVQEVVRDLTREAAQRVKARVVSARVHVDVLARDAVWALDQFFVGRDAHGPVSALEVCDCCTRRTLALSVGPPARGKDVVALLEAAAANRGGVWPFVVQADNGPENTNAEVEACLRDHQVILLRNLPYTPQHNPFAEHNNGELLRASGLGNATRRAVEALREALCPGEAKTAGTRTSLAARLAAAWQALDVGTPRAALGGRTPEELDRNRPCAQDRACRARFYTHVRKELERIARAALSKRDRRKQEREAIWCALEQHGLVQRTRGGLPVRAFKSEVIS